MAAKTMTPQEAGIPDITVHYRPHNAVPVFVGGYDKSGNPHSWESVANLHGMHPQDLVYYNYRTTKAEVVNFYMERNCGCKVLTADGKNYRFLNAYPGLIFVPAFPPLARFDRIDILPMEVRPHPTLAGKFRMKAVFQVNVRFDARLDQPMLYEYRQMIRGGGFTQRGRWVNAQWEPQPLPGGGAAPPVPIPSSAFKIPGTPPGLLPHAWKEDGLIFNGRNLHYGHRGSPPAPPSTGRDEYSPDGYAYLCEDWAGPDEGDVVIGARIWLEMQFKGVVVRFDKGPGVAGRKIVEQVAERHWKYRCDRKIVSLTPFIAIP